MNKKKIVIIVVIAILAIAGGYYIMNYYKTENVVICNNTIDGVGSFQAIDVCDFKLSPISDDNQKHYVGNDTIAQISVISSASAINKTISEAEKVNDSAGGHAIYKNTANVGEHKGDVRYFAVIEDNGRFIFITTDSYNQTCTIVDSFEIL